VVHVRDVHRAVRRIADVHRSKQLIDAVDELRSRIHVAKLGQAFDVLDLRAANQPADRLGEEQITLQIGRQPVAADNRRTGRRGEVIQVLCRHARAEEAALHVANAGRRPDHGEVLLEAVLHPRRTVGIRCGRRTARAAAARRRARRVRPVVDRELEVHRSAFAARVHEPRFPVIVRGKSPLAAVRRGRLAQEPGRRPPDPERVVGRVDPVVQVPEQARLLVLDVGVATLADAGEHDFALVGDAVAVGVGQLQQIVGVGLAGENHAILQRQDHARRHQLVGEHSALVVPAVAFRALPSRDPADRLMLPARLGVHHVADHLADIHPAVAVELDQGWVDHVGLGRHQLHAVTGGQHETPGLLLRSPRGDRRLRREVRGLIGLRPSPAATKPADPDRRRIRGLLRAGARHLELAVHDRHVRPQSCSIRRERQHRWNRVAAHR
jgi:hypothetical protein